MCRQIIDYFDNKKVLILGFGKEGQSTYNFIRKYYPEKLLIIADKRELEIDDKFVEVISGEKYLDAISDSDLVMQSPGISLRDVKIPENVEISGQMDLFLRFAPCKKVGITGTKGKTTTTTLIYNVVKESGKKCFLIGNIGVPVFESLDDIDGAVAVIEMSCHQLEFAKASPDVAVFTNIYPEHLDHYNGFEGYVNAKLNIVKNQNEDGVFICNKDQDMSEYLDFSQVKSTVERVGKDDWKDNEYFRELSMLNENLRGEHTKQDIFFAATAAKHLGIDEKFVYESIKKFNGIPHRLEKVGTFREITFYNDSIATIPHAVICNIEALGNVGSLIFGGMDRGIDYDGFVEYLGTCDIENLIGLPETGFNIIDRLTALGCKKKMFKTETMDEAVKTAYENTEKGKSCLFSPAASSYNRYKNFEEKGEHFKTLCREFK